MGLADEGGSGCKVLFELRVRVFLAAVTATRGAAPGHLERRGESRVTLAHSQLSPGSGGWEDRSTRKTARSRSRLYRGKSRKPPWILAPKQDFFRPGKPERRRKGRDSPSPVPFPGGNEGKQAIKSAP